MALKSTYSNLSEAFLRSDNAGCCHNAFPILSLPSIVERAGIRVLRYDFGDPQAGKDVCDRRIATLKSHMRRFINEGNDINTTQQMKVAIESYGGIKGCYATVAEIQDSFQNMTKHTMTGIQALNNFLFEPAGLRAWKACNLKKHGAPQGPTGIKELQPFSQPFKDVGTFRATQAQEVGPSVPTEVQIRQSEEADTATRSVASYSCPEQGCVKIYKEFKSLQKHLDVGRHLIKLERESDYDNIIAKWAETCKTVSGDYVQESPSVAADSPSLEEGWALKKAKKSARFSERVRSFLQGTFFQGEQTSVKANPADIASKMKSLRSANGNKLFSKEEWLSTLQVARYFSRLSALNKRGFLKQNVTASQEEEEDDPDYVSEIEAMEKRFQIRRELEL
ncbi:hypothetical protein P5673_026481 [Acropora cervicornis]|uniref:C2H2-type domain-containing protein n=1 Tax=Acropora cervicornis TaxID=6130 RepID=A0AAD9Q128_ACRCE|nr:hypothetical protein P5673_026481 [Acropora cervicornis]